MRKSTKPQPTRTFRCPQCYLGVAVNAAQFADAVCASALARNVDLPCILADEDELMRLALDKFAAHPIGGAECCARRQDNAVASLDRLKHGLRAAIDRATIAVAKHAEQLTKSVLEAQSALRWSADLFATVTYANVAAEALAALNGEGIADGPRTVAQVREYAIGRALMGAREANSQSTSATCTLSEQSVTAAWAKLAQDLAFHLEA